MWGNCHHVPLPTTTHPPGFRYVRAWVGANATLLVRGQYQYGGAVPIVACGAPTRSQSPIKNPLGGRGWAGGAGASLCGCCPSRNAVELAPCVKLAGDVVDVPAFGGGHLAQVFGAGLGVLVHVLPHGSA